MQPNEIMFSKKGDSFAKYPHFVSPMGPEIEIQNDLAKSEALESLKKATKATAIVFPALADITMTGHNGLEL